MLVRIVGSVLEKARDIWRPEPKFAGYRETALQKP